MDIFVKVGLIAALAAVLLMPTTIKVAGDELVPGVEHTTPVQKRGSWNALPLPPVPYLETMPWLVQERAPESLKIDTLFAPKFEMAPAVAGVSDGGMPSSALQHSRRR
jgi:hypothetical protein